VLPDVEPDPHNATFQVIAIYDPRYCEPWLLATDLPLEPETAKALYHDRWPVEQIPLAAKHMVGAHRVKIELICPQISGLKCPLFSERFVH
jgi:hypothetical protein